MNDGMNDGYLFNECIFLTMECLFCTLVGVSFTPREVGEHLVSVFRSGKHIANSPFKISVGEHEIADARRVKVFGAGLEHASARQVILLTLRNWSLML